MRALLLMGTLLLATLAGCLDAGTEETQSLDLDPALGPGSVAGHPSFGFVTNDDLEASVDAAVPRPDRDVNGLVIPPGVDAWKLPEYRPLPEELGNIEKISGSEGSTGTQGIGVFGPLAVAGNPLQVIDITDMENPHVISELEGVPVRDADFILYPDGRLVVVTTGGGAQMYFVDITDAYAPELVGQIETNNANHNIAVVPGTPIVYNSPSSGNNNELAPTVNDPTAEGAGKMDIVVASDPSNPYVHKEWTNGYGCHDTAFYMNTAEDKFRAYCAGIEQLQIWDLADPLEPVIVSQFGWPAGGVEDAGAVGIVTFAHLAIVNHDASILILGDETGGGAAPGCDVSAHDPVTGTTVTGPLGNLWFYDLSDETAPVLQGSVSPSAYEQRGSCTAHFGQVVEDTNHVVMGFYSAGVVLVDFTDPENPYVKSRYEPEPTLGGDCPVIGESENCPALGTVWDVWYHSGYLVTGDMDHGVDILTFT